MTRDPPLRARLRRAPAIGVRAHPARAPGRDAHRLIQSRLTPNAISLTGLALNLVAAVLVWERLFFLGGIAFIIGSVMDTLDGRYSRMSGKGTPFGAFLDSTLDRVEEGIVLTAVAADFARHSDAVAAAAVVVAVLASLMVSYTRARAEALGVECKVGSPPARCAWSSCRSGSVRPRRLARQLRAARAGGVRARRPQRHHRRPTHLARARGAGARRGGGRGERACNPGRPAG